MEKQKNKRISISLPSLGGMFSVVKRVRLGRRTRRVAGVLVLAIFVGVLYRTLIATRVTYGRTDQSVVAPFTIHFSSAIKSVDMASLKITPATPGKWSIQRGTVLGDGKLEFMPTNGFKPATHYTVSSFTAKRLVGGTTQIRGMNFMTVHAPGVVASGFVTLANGSVIAPDTSFTVKLAEPNKDVRNLKLIATPNVTVSRTTSDNDTTYTWHPKKLLPSGQTIRIAVYDTRSRQTVAQKQVIIAEAPQVASFSESTGFSQGDVARITFNKPINTDTAKVHFDVAGSGAWESSTIYAFTPTTVQPAQTYHYTVDAGVRSTDGGLTSQPLAGSFSAFGHVSVTKASPTGSGLNQAGQVVSFTFDHAVDHQSAVDHFSISAGTVASESWSGNTFLVKVVNLGYGQTVTATMASGVANAGFGLPSNQPAQVVFHTAPAISAGVVAQLAYATAHWNDTTNATYGNLDSVGGDCANFVSQTLIARGWRMDSQWYNHGSGQWSAAWGYVPSLDNYMSSNSGKFGLQYLTASQRSQFAVGDVVVFSWEGTTNAKSQQDHVEMISQITNQNGQVSVKLASHNNYGLYRDLDEQITTEHPGATFHVWHLTRDTN
jgi:hypothetical protein